MYRKSRYWSERCGCRAKAMAVMVVSAISLVALGGKAAAIDTTINYNYTGAAQLWMVPLGVSALTSITLYGASGGDGGFGGSPRGYLQVSGSVTPGMRYQVNVGGMPTGRGVGGWNGGGVGGTSLGNHGGCGGGGASDVRTGGFSVNERILVVGGGGGDGNVAQGGYGYGNGSGGPGGVGGDASCSPATGGTLYAGGVGGGYDCSTGGGYVGFSGSQFWGGNGANGSYVSAGGGGGYYGGGGGGISGTDYFSGGGGSGYCDPTWTQIDSGDRTFTGNGEISFAYPTNTPWTSLGQVMSADPTGLIWDAGNGPGRIDVFYVDTNLNISQMFREAGGVWQGPFNRGGRGVVATLRPAVASWGSGLLSVFATGLDNQLYYTFWTPTAGWSAWLSLGGSIDSAPTACSYGNGHVDVFARGINNDLQHIAYSNGAWGSWESRGGALAPNYSPAAISNAPNRLEVYVKDTNGGGGLSYMVWDGNHGGWSGWFQLDDGGVTLSSDPAVFINEVLCTNVLFRDSSNGITSRSCIPGSWFAWQVQGAVTSGAGALGAPNGAAPALIPCFSASGDVYCGVAAFIRGWNNILYTVGPLP